MSSKEPTDRELIDAVNLLCDFVSDRLPDGWQLSLVMSRDEAYLELMGPDGDTHPDADSGGDGSSIRNSVEYAIEAQAEDDAENEDED